MTPGDRFITSVTTVAAAMTSCVDYEAFIDEGKTFDEAEAECVSKGGNLASFHGDEFYDVDSAIARGEPDFGSYWIGFREVALYAWGWTDGTPTDWMSWNE